MLIVRVAPLYEPRDRRCSTVYNPRAAWVCGSVRSHAFCVRAHRDIVKSLAKTACPNGRRVAQQSNVFSVHRDAQPSVELLPLFACIHSCAHPSIAPDSPRSARSTHRVWCLLSAISTVLVLGLAPTPALAGSDSVTVSALKAAFLLNFAKFSQWPIDSLAAGQRLGMCVVGDVAVADALTQTIKGRPIDGHELEVSILTTDAPTIGCHLLFVSASEMKRSSTMLMSLNGAAMFTVSDADHFAESGGVAQLIVERERMRFAINLDAAQRVRLRISSKLLALAKVIRDTSHDSERRLLGTTSVQLQ